MHARTIMRAKAATKTMCTTIRGTRASSTRWMIEQVLTTRAKASKKVMMSKERIFLNGCTACSNGPRKCSSCTRMDLPDTIADIDAEIDLRLNHQAEASEYLIRNIGVLWRLKMKRNMLQQRG